MISSKLVRGSRLSRFSRTSNAYRSSHSNTRSSLARFSVPLLTHRNVLQAAFYTTERIVTLRSGKVGQELPKTVYRPDKETENCGVGLIASLRSVPSRRVVEQADEMLVRMSHRGGCGCDPASGDGAGMYIIFVNCHNCICLNV
jgi:hypothetical protein